MMTKTTLTRRAFFNTVAAQALAVAAITAFAAPTAAQAQANACLNVGGVMLCSQVGALGTPVQAQALLHAGNYQGYWHDGRAMIERVTVTPNEITLHRIAGGDVQGQTFRYIRSGSNTYNSPNGHTILITGPTSFTWTNSGGRNGVAYSLLQ